MCLACKSICIFTVAAGRAKSSNLRIVVPNPSLRGVLCIVFSFYLCTESTLSEATWVFPKIVVPQNGWFIRKALLEWMIWGYHYFWKHPHMYLNAVVYVNLNLVMVAVSNLPESVLGHQDTHGVTRQNICVRDWVPSAKDETDNQEIPIAMTELGVRCMFLVVISNMVARLSYCLINSCHQLPEPRKST